MDVWRLLNDLLSYNGNMMLFGVLFLLICVLFSLCLHIFGPRWLDRARAVALRRCGLSSPYYLNPPNFRNFNTLEPAVATLQTQPATMTKGLDSESISTIPVFIYEEKKRRLNLSELKLECAICLGDFAENELGRRLPNCGHVFHLECIDMWLGCHFSCPICRSLVVCVNNDELEQNNNAETELNGGVPVLGVSSAGSDDYV